MSVFNRLFRTKAHISKAEPCKFKSSSSPFPFNGIELKLMRLVRGKNFSIIIPDWAFEGMKEFQGPDGKTSLELIRGCNVVIEIQSSSEYRAKRKQFLVAKKELGTQGKVVDLSEYKKKQVEMARKQKKEQDKLKKQWEKQQKLLKRRKVS